MPFWKVFHIRYVDTHALPALYSAPTHGWCFTSSYWAAHESYRLGSEDRSSRSPGAGPFQAFGKCDSRRYSTSLMWPPLLSKHPIVPLHMGGVNIFIRGSHMRVVGSDRRTRGSRSPKAGATSPLQTPRDPHDYFLSRRYVTPSRLFGTPRNFNTPPFDPTRLPRSKIGPPNTSLNFPRFHGTLTRLHGSFPGLVYHA